VEAASLQALVEVVSSLGGTTLIGEHIPTARNGMVANHYKTLGFAPTAPLATGKNGTTRWSLEIGASLPHHHIAVEIGKSVNQLFPSRELMRKMA
jgi:predicted enzyme involved in methoxymalonyl-ACP biosynthesis